MRIGFRIWAAGFSLVLLGACQVPTSRSEDRTSSPVPSAPTAEAGDPAFALDRAPADLGCDAVGWPEDVEPFATLTVFIDPASSPQVWATSDTGRRLRIEWVPGFEPAPDGSAAVVGPDGAEVARGGQVIPLLDGAEARLGAYPLCITPTVVHVLLPPPHSGILVSAHVA